VSFADATHSVASQRMSIIIHVKCDSRLCNCWF